MAKRTKISSETKISEAPEIPTSIDVKTFLLGGLFIIAVLFVLRVADVILIPFTLALILKFVFHPVIRRCEKYKIPKKAAAFIIILLLLGGIFGIGSSLSAPAAEWGAKIQEQYPAIKERLYFVRKPMMKTQKMLSQADNITNSGTQKEVVVVEGSNLSDKIISGMQKAVSGLFMTLLILLFMLTASDTFLRKFVEILPRFQDKRRAVDITHEIEHDISRYLLTITSINLCVGILAGLVMFIFNVENPFLWGALVFLLNYIPIIGPLVGILLFCLVGLISTPDITRAFLPSALYLLIHIMEGSFFTPLFLAKRFTINPVIIICSLIFWYWMWGIIGAIIAMPLLAILKITCDRIERLASFGHVLEG